jgi:hypothetical protein
MKRDKDFEEWYAEHFEGDMFWSKKDDCYIPIKAHYMWMSWKEQQKKIDEGHRKIESQYNMIKSIQAYGEAMQKKIDLLEDKIEGLKFDVSQAYTHN